MRSKRQARWKVSSGNISEFVYADDQWAAWDSLRERHATEFGLIAEAELNENGEPIPVRTTLLMFRWGREDDANAFAKLGKSHGMPDTRKQDRAAAMLHK